MRKVCGRPTSMGPSKIFFASSFSSNGASQGGMGKLCIALDVSDRPLRSWKPCDQEILRLTWEQIHSFPPSRTKTKTGDLKITTKEAFRWTIITLRKFANLLAKIIIAWERFDKGEMQYFYSPQSGELADSRWGTYISSIDKDVNHLRDLLGSLKDQTKLFEDMTTNVG